MTGHKKHYTMMTTEELECIQQRLAELVLHPSPHTLQRLRDWCITTLPSLDECRIIEFNTHSEDARVLLRHSTGLCFVVSLRTGDVVTAYRNDPTDTHATLQRSQYFKGLKVNW